MMSFRSAWWFFARSSAPLRNSQKIPKLHYTSIIKKFTKRMSFRYGASRTGDQGNYNLKRYALVASPSPASAPFPYFKYPEFTNDAAKGEKSAPIKKAPSAPIRVSRFFYLRKLFPFLWMDGGNSMANNIHTGSDVARLANYRITNIKQSIPR